MTEITLDKKTFLATLDAFTSKFELATEEIILAVGKEQGRFSLAGTRKGGIPIEAFGPCQTKGEALSVGFPITELKTAIEEAHTSVDVPSITLLATSAGIWVKEPEMAGGSKPKEKSAAERAVVRMGGQ